MRKLLALLLVALIALAFSGCKTEKKLQDKVDEFIQSYIYTIRDAVDGQKGTVKDVYDKMVSSEMKKVVTFDEYKDWVTRRYKGKVGKKIRTAKAAIVIDKHTKAFMEATGRTSNVGRMAAAMNQDESLIFTVRVVKEGEQFKVEQQDVMGDIMEKKEEDTRLTDLLKDYKGLIKIDEIVGKRIQAREGWAELVGTILNGSKDLDMIRVGIRVKFKDSNGDVIWADKFLAVTDMRFEGLRTSLLPNSVKIFKTKVKDLPKEWDPEQPLSYSFYLIDGNKIDEKELAVENKERSKLKKLIEDTKKADEEARKQLKEVWEKEKALKKKIKELQNQSK